MLKCCSGRPKRAGAGALYKERVNPRSSAPESSIVENSSKPRKRPKTTKTAEAQKYVVQRITESRAAPKTLGGVRGWA